tara:strand:- start:1945 stop:2376 length:432 start_codon:yes stop_codon:yes gene_type:complete
MEFERYEDIIDAFERDNMGYETLTDYIRGENIKLQGKPFTSDENLPIGSKPKEGIMATDEAMLIAERPEKDRMLAERDPLLVEEYEKYVFDMLEQGLEPMSFEQFRSAAFAGEAKAPVETEEVVKEKKVISLAEGGLSKLLEV